MKLLTTTVSCGRSKGSKIRDDWEVHYAPVETLFIVSMSQAEKSTDRKDSQSYVVVAIDKMKVKGLFYYKHKCQVVRFVNLGDTNTKILAFE